MILKKIFGDVCFSKTSFSQAGQKRRINQWWHDKQQKKLVVTAPSDGTDGPGGGGAAMAAPAIAPVLPAAPSDGADGLTWWRSCNGSCNCACVACSSS